MTGELRRKEDPSEETASGRKRLDAVLARFVVQTANVFPGSGNVSPSRKNNYLHGLFSKSESRSYLWYKFGFTDVPAFPRNRWSPV